MNNSGLFMIGVLAGVEIVPSGKLENGAAYGASVKLKFHIQETINKMIDGSPVAQQTSRTVTTQISTTDAELLGVQNKYNTKIGKSLKLRLEPADNSRFKLLGDESDLPVVAKSS